MDLYIIKCQFDHRFELKNLKRESKLNVFEKEKIWVWYIFLKIENLEIWIWVEMSWKFWIQNGDPNTLNIEDQPADFQWDKETKATPR